jgi:hypothetical protein
LTMPIVPTGDGAMPLSTAHLLVLAGPTPRQSVRHALCLQGLIYPKLC